MARRKKYKPPFKPAGRELARLLAYWCDSIVEGERAEISPKDILDSGLETSLEDAKRGFCSPHAVTTLKAKRDKKESERNHSRGANARQFDLRVWVCPMRLAKTTQAPGPRFAELMWMPAILLDDGTLQPSKADAPWIPREHMEPATRENSVTIGSNAAMTKFARKNPVGGWSSWENYWDYAERLFKAVSGDSMKKFELEGFERQQAFITLDASSTASNSLARLLEEVSAGKRHPGLLGRFATLKRPTATNYTFTRGAVARAGKLHRGQFSSDFALAPTQRLAVQRFMETPKGDFLCVTGPPGTGKTTLLQSVVASLWIESANGAKSRPPVILACGATNQSVMNIIDSFGKGAVEKNLFSARWLPRVNSYGSFCCSVSKSREASGYQLELRSGEGFSHELENPQFIAEAENYFLQCFSDWCGKKLSLSQAALYLQRQIRTAKLILGRDISKLKDGTLGEWLQSLVGMRKFATAQEIFTGLAQFDTELRYHAFNLATHYWESRWLLEVKNEYTGRRAKMQSTKAEFRGEKTDWQRRAMLTPAFVSTLAMAPKFFASRSEVKEPPLDLLIFDEAGQIPVEYGVACSVLASRALIVGDCNQLEPVWNMPPHLDQANAVEHKLVRQDNEADWQKLVDRSLTASSGSMMLLALRSSRKIEGYSYGVFLTEHRRSVPRLVNFLNTLSYGNRLEPHRAAPESTLFPAFGYVHVKGVCRQLGHSRYNPSEVDQIEAWLLANEQAVKTFYQTKDISDSVAVITPFAAQNIKLRERLRKKYLGMVIGTVNSLQGAERRVVLFSSVYDAAYNGEYFFDMGTNMLNVAVSRAQDSFVVFGDMGIFDPETTAPSSVLAKFLFADAGNELGGVDLPGREQSLPSGTRRLSTLREHQEMLFEAIEHAQREVIIVSPTISSSALTADRIPDVIRAARERGVRVRVFTDCYLDMPDGKIKPNAEAGRKLLIDAGAELNLTKAIHNKSLAIDDHTLVEGSFNWLSAVRSVGSIHQKFETSSCNRGSDVPAEIKALREELEHRARLLATGED